MREIFPARSICKIIEHQRRDGRGFGYTIWYKDGEEWIEMEMAPASTVNEARRNVRDFMTAYNIGFKDGKKETKKK